MSDSLENLAEQVKETAAQAKAASRLLASAGGQAKEQALIILAGLLRENSRELILANEKDLAAAREKGLDAPRLDRLTLTEKIIEEMSLACLEVAAMPDPVGGIDGMWTRPNGLLVGRMRIPLGVIAIIYESRPNVTIDSAILCLKAGNAVILRGGSEAINSNTALAGLISRALTGAGLPESGVRVIGVTDRAAVSALLKLDDYIDVVIPRGGEELIRAVTTQAAMPVLKHYKGVCHAYVDETADLAQALEIVYNAKVSRPGVCNALECLLVHQKIAGDFLPLVRDRLVQAGVSLRTCPKALPLLGGKANPAAPDDFGREFHDLILAVKVVDDQDMAQEHISRYGSNHTELICARDHDRAMRFLRQVDASLVIVNASTRFNDGGQLGLGAEIGISTSKLHSYGPMGVRELTSTKFVLFGQGQVRV